MEFVFVYSVSLSVRNRSFLIVEDFDHYRKKFSADPRVEGLVGVKQIRCNRRWSSSLDVSLVYQLEIRVF